MAAVVADFFQIVGVSAMPPQNLAELIPYLLQVVVGICLVSAVFSAVGKIARVFINFRRW